MKYQTFGLVQTIWTDKFWGILGTFGRFISTHFGTVSPLSMFFIIQPVFLQKAKPFHPNPKYLFGMRFEFEFGPQRIRDLAIVCS
jgi:hypothetical protein